MNLLFFRRPCRRCKESDLTIRLLTEEVARRDRVIGCLREDRKLLQIILWDGTKKGANRMSKPTGRQP